MVKAIKRKADADVKIKKKSGWGSRRLGGVAILIIMGLIIIGFTLNVPVFTREIEEELEEGPVETNYGVGSLLGMQQGSVGEVSDYHAVFGQLNVPVDLSRRLGGDLYLLGNGLSQLILTNASSEDIEDSTSGEFIIYTIASCGEFDCLLQNITNETQFYDIYELDKDSDFIKTNKVGFPSTFAGTVL